MNNQIDGDLGVVGNSSIFDPLINAWNSFGSSKEEAERNISVLKDYSDGHRFKLVHNALVAVLRLLTTKLQ